MKLFSLPPKQLAHFACNSPRRSRASRAPAAPRCGQLRNPLGRRGGGRAPQRKGCGTGPGVE